MSCNLVIKIEVAFLLYIKVNYGIMFLDFLKNAFLPNNFKYCLYQFCRLSSISDETNDMPRFINFTLAGTQMVHKKVSLRSNAYSPKTSMICFCSINKANKTGIEFIYPLCFGSGLGF